tara:strand:- start:62 stop:388 length:327 start_codon:yes stop_codon:yes gene_type:complete
MATLKTSDSNFEVDVIKSSSPVIVDFWAEWCGPCLQIAPVLEDISEERKDVVKIYKINIDENPLTPQKYGVRGIPTLILFKDGKVFDSKIGSLSKSMLNEWINTNLNI